jgi:hypothetical protein
MRGRRGLQIRAFALNALSLGLGFSGDQGNGSRGGNVLHVAQKSMLEQKSGTKKVKAGIIIYASPPETVRRQLLPRKHAQAGISKTALPAAFISRHHHIVLRLVRLSVDCADPGIHPSSPRSTDMKESRKRSTTAARRASVPDCMLKTCWCGQSGRPYAKTKDMLCLQKLIFVSCRKFLQEYSK